MDELGIKHPSKERVDGIEKLYKTTSVHMYTRDWILSFSLRT